MTSTAIGIALGSLILVSSILLFVSLWNTYFTTYINALKAFSEKAVLWSKARMLIGNITLVKQVNNNHMVIKRLIITLNNSGSMDIRLDNFTFILIECLNNRYVPQKVIKTHVGSAQVKLSQSSLPPGGSVNITMFTKISVSNAMCSYIKVIVSTGSGLIASRIIHVS